MRRESNNPVVRLIVDGDESVTTIEVNFLISSQVTMRF
jgi:hypothetical protein